MANATLKAAETQPMPATSRVQETPRPVPRWALHRRLYDWVSSLAHRKYATPALFAIAFAESSFFPIPPDVLQIALTLERRERAWYYALISLLGSVAGALLGYLIGWGCWELTRDLFIPYVFSQEAWDAVATPPNGLYHRWDFWVVFVAAFTPIPYKIITIAAGVCHISLPMFIVASLVGRGARFFLVAALFWWFGPAVKSFIDRYFNWVCIVFTILLIGGFVVIKYAANH